MGISAEGSLNMPVNYYRNRLYSGCGRGDVGPNTPASEALLSLNSMTQDAKMKLTGFSQLVLL
jgi:hypothetical protein